MMGGQEGGWGRGSQLLLTSLRGAGDGDRWEELHTLASEPREQHLLMVEQAEDATNGLLSTLSRSAICTVASPGKASRAKEEWAPPCGSGVGRVPRDKRSRGSPGRGRARGSGSHSFRSGVLCCLPPCVRPWGASQLRTLSLSLRDRGAQGVGPRPGGTAPSPPVPVPSSGGRATSAPHFSWGEVSAFVAVIIRVPPGAGSEYVV